MIDVWSKRLSDNGKNCLCIYKSLRMFRKSSLEINTSIITASYFALHQIKHLCVSSRSSSDECKDECTHALSWYNNTFSLAKCSLYIGSRGPITTDNSLHLSLNFFE